MQELIAVNERECRGQFTGEILESLLARHVVTVRDCVHASHFRRDGFPSTRGEGLFFKITKTNGRVVKIDSQGKFIPFPRVLTGIILLEDLGKSGVIDFLKDPSMRRSIPVTYSDGITTPLYRSVPSRRILSYEDICTLRHGIVEGLMLDALLLSWCDENAFFIEGTISRIDRKVR